MMHYRSSRLALMAFARKDEPGLALSLEPLNELLNNLIEFHTVCDL